MRNGYLFFINSIGFRGSWFFYCLRILGSFIVIRVFYFFFKYFDKML